MMFRDSTVDHVLPENLLAKPEKLQSIFDKYGLSSVFKINDYENWVPAHNRCNSSKGDRLMGASPAMVFALSKVGRLASKARKVEAKFAADKQNAKLIAILEDAVAGEQITKEDLERLVQSTPKTIAIPEVGGPRQMPEVVPGWQIISTQGRMAIVSNGRGSGIISLDADPDPSWNCPFCGSNGPWDGIICLTCGKRSEPD